MRVLITGASGQVGKSLLRSAPATMELSALTRAELDISDVGDVRAAVAVFKPSLIINAAAYTAVDKAESEPELAWAVNAEGPRHLARAAHALPGCRLLHISTDYVFDGRAPGPYEPLDQPNPLTAYGRSKLLGEAAVIAALHERSVILRTAWVYAAEGSNFLLTMLRLMRDFGTVKVVADQYGTPTAADSIARALWAIVARPTIRGIVHWTDAGSATWYDFAVAIAIEGFAAGVLAMPAQVEPIATADHPTAAHQPVNSLLDCRESITQLGIRPSSWQINLRATLAQVAASNILRDAGQQRAMARIP